MTERKNCSVDDCLMFANFYSSVDAVKIFDDSPPSLDHLEFSRIYNGKRNRRRCKHISGRMAHRLYLQGEMMTDSFRESFDLCFIDGLFREYDKLYGNDDKLRKRYIKRSYLDYMLSSEDFQNLIVHSLNRILCRLVKGLGFECNCIAEVLVAYHVIIVAQSAFVDGEEVYHFDLNARFDDNPWQFLKESEKLDANFLCVYERELSINVNKSLNKVRENTCGYVVKSLEQRQNMQQTLEEQQISKSEWYRGEDINEDEIDSRMDPKEYNLYYLNRVKQKMRILIEHGHELVDYKHPEIGNLRLIKSMNLNYIHPSKWFIPFNPAKVMNFYLGNDDMKRVRVRKRCIVCKKRKNQAKIKKFKKCKQCKKELYCGRKCQKYHWKHAHGTSSRSNGFCECLYWRDSDELGFFKASQKHLGVDFSKYPPQS